MFPAFSGYVSIKLKNINLWSWNKLQWLNAQFRHCHHWYDLHSLKKRKMNSPSKRINKARHANHREHNFLFGFGSCVQWQKWQLLTFKWVATEIKLRRKGNFPDFVGVSGECLCITLLQLNIKFQVQKLTAWSKQTDHMSRLDQVSADIKRGGGEFEHVYAYIHIYKVPCWSCNEY